MISSLELESQRVVSLFEYNYGHSEKLREAGFCVDWHPHIRRRALSFMAGHISAYSEELNLLFLHYHVHVAEPLDIGGVWMLKREAVNMLTQIAQSLQLWETDQSVDPQIFAVIAASYPALTNVLGRIMPCFTSIGYIPYGTAYARSLRRLGEHGYRSDRHDSRGPYEILATDTATFIRTFLPESAS